MNREQKVAVVEAIAGQIRESAAVYAIDYRGISVTQAAELRARLREADASFRVVKNTLTLRAVDLAQPPGTESLKALLEGPTALAFVHGDAAAAAKALSDYGRQTNLLVFKGGLMDGEALDAEQVRSIARLPSREALYGQLVGGVAAPISGLVRTLNALISGLAVQLGQIAEQGLVAGAPAAQTPVTESGGGIAAPEAATSETNGDESPAPEEPDQDAEQERHVQPDQAEGEEEDIDEEDA